MRRTPDRKAAGSIPAGRTTGSYSQSTQCGSAQAARLADNYLEVETAWSTRRTAAHRTVASAGRREGSGHITFYLVVADPQARPWRKSPGWVGALSSADRSPRRGHLRALRGSCTADADDERLGEDAGVVEEPAASAAEGAPEELAEAT